MTESVTTHGEPAARQRDFQGTHHAGRCSVTTDHYRTRKSLGERTHTFEIGFRTCAILEKNNRHHHVEGCGSSGTSKRRRHAELRGQSRERNNLRQCLGGGGGKKHARRLIKHRQQGFVERAVRRTTCCNAREFAEIIARN